MRNKGLTLLEILISSLILALLMTGLANIFVAGKKLIMHSRSRMVSGELGKVFLDPLQMAVRQDTWADAANPLYSGVRYCDGNPAHTQQPGCPSSSERTLDKKVYSAQYTVSRGSPIGNVNRVTVNVTWSE